MLTWVADDTASDYQISEIARVQFYAETLTLEESTGLYKVDHQWFDSIECKDKYSA